MSLKTTLGQQLPVNVVGSSNFGRYNKISSEKTYNMFISDGWLVNFPGYKKVLEFAVKGQGRGIFRSIRNNLAIAVINDAVYVLSPELHCNLIGYLKTNQGEVSIDENLNNQICIVDGTFAYIYNSNLAPNLTVQSLGDLVPNYVTYHNTFFLFGNGDISSNGAAWYAYSYDSPTTIVKATQMALQTKPDYAIAIKRIPGQAANVLVFGTTVCEVHTQVGGIFNYRRNNGVSVDYGCLSVSTIDSSENFIAWLAVNERNAPIILVYSGQGATPISTDGIDYVLSQIQFPNHSTASFMRVDGHLIYQLTFYNPVDNISFAYDFTTEKFFHLSDQALNFHPAQNYLYFNQKTYFLSLNNAALYQISSDIKIIDENKPGEDFEEYKHEIQRVRITDTIMQDDSDPFIANFFNLVIEQGHDERYPELALQTVNGIITEEIFDPPLTLIVTEQGFDIVDEYSWGGVGRQAYVMPYEPRVDLALSVDGGITWSSYVGKTLRPLGYRKSVLRWTRLGRMNSLTFKFRFWGTDRFVVNNGMLEIK